MSMVMRKRWRSTNRESKSTAQVSGTPIFFCFSIKYLDMVRVGRFGSVRRDKGPGSCPFIGVGHSGLANRAKHMGNGYY